MKVSMNKLLVRVERLAVPELLAAYAASEAGGKALSPPAAHHVTADVGVVVLVQQAAVVAYLDVQQVPALPPFLLFLVRQYLF